MPFLSGSPWRKGGASLLVREDTSSRPSEKIAAFDLNDTLVSSKIGAPGYQVTVSDWTFYNAAVPQKLKELHEEGFRLVIFTNQGNIRSALDGKRALAFKGYVDAFLKEVGVPMLVLASTQRDDFRKPKIGMWQYLESKVNGSIAINKTQSFFVGDAAGGPGEHSADDANFAKAVGVRFVHTNDFFGGCAGSVEGPPKKAPRLSTLGDSMQKDVDFNMSQGPLLLVLVGLPGSGKTTFAERLGPTPGDCKNHGPSWRRICQDLLRSKEACLRAASSCLDEGLSVIIDRTDINVEQRAPWVQLAQKKGAACHALIFDVPLEECCRRAQQREHHEGGLRGGGVRPVIMKLHKMQQPVEPDEGFARVRLMKEESDLNNELQRYGEAANPREEKTEPPKDQSKPHAGQKELPPENSEADRKVELLKSMGFEQDACVEALKAASGDTNLAANQLLADRLV